ncbi:hypothetical protein [Paenibacillus tianjinensis]|uniref:Uncharacterized protein n=1 Tax=Paenibacillus tianjinensis TaxID=2810347 RepID=A0ABX7LC61_9BACL|nr:hypothetical protein [Paenibacillus tianjinensis]QSF45516.1 hypothetical protein JRJ22_02295 [Paenibacillus tianjinensis]
MNLLLYMLQVVRISISANGIIPPTAGRIQSGPVLPAERVMPVVRNAVIRQDNLRPRRSGTSRHSLLSQGMYV